MVIVIPAGADPEPWVEILRVLQALLGAVVGGLLVIVAGWIADRRKFRNERASMQRREAALLTGMFAVRNHIALRLGEYEEHGRASQLAALKTAQTYVHRLIDKAPGESEGLMIAVLEVGLKLDALMATIDGLDQAPKQRRQEEWPQLIGVQVGELAASLEQFDVISHGSLDFLTDEDLRRMGWPGEAEGSTGDPK